MKFTLYTADCSGNEQNCRYPMEAHVDSAESLSAAVAKDHVCASFKDSHRSVAAFQACDVIMLDCDNDHSDDPAAWVTPEQFAGMVPEVAFAAVPSRHDSQEKDGRSARPRWHAYFPVGIILDAQKCRALKVAVQARFPFFDANCLDAARFVYGSEAGQAFWHEGSQNMDQLPQPVHKERSISEGQRNSTMSHFAGRVIKRYGVTGRAHDIFMEEAAKCEPPLSEEELRTIWHSAEKFAEVLKKQPGYVPPEEYEFQRGNLMPTDFSDIGQAKVLSREYRDELRYNPSTEFLHYNGAIWEESEPAAVGAVEQFLDLQLADAVDRVKRARQALLDAGVSAESMAKGGKKLEKELDENQHQAYGEYAAALSYQAFVMQRRNMRYIKSAMETAKPMLYVEYGALDQNPFLLNTPEATYDLRLGLSSRRPHAQEDLLTKAAITDPGEQGTDLWKDTLGQTFLGDMELIGYVQEVIGLAAVGKVYVEMLVIAYGDGRNGKSTFFNTISRVLGSYSGGLSADSLTVGCRRNVKWEITELKGKRLVIAAELQEGTRLSDATVKQLCSTDDIMGEKKFKAPSPFAPSHTCVLYTNHLPKVGALDEGIWRRLVVIPFNAVFEGSSDHKNYAEYLVHAAGPAVMSWIIEGARRVIAKNYRLSMPGVVRDATEAYRQDNDWLHHFLHECCEMGDGDKEKAGELYQEYRAYCERIGDFTRSAADFSNALINAGYERRKMKHGNFFKGLMLKSEFLN